MNSLQNQIQSELSKRMKPHAAQRMAQKIMDLIKMECRIEVTTIIAQLTAKELAEKGYIKQETEEIPNK